MGFGFEKASRVLLVEDAPDIQLIVSSALAPHCHLTCVGTIAGAREELNRDRYSLVILDVGLPDGNGFELCEELKSPDAQQEISVIFLTGKSTVDEKVLGFSVGADDYITKPIEPAEFTARVRSKLKKPRGTNERAHFNRDGFKIDLVAQRAFVSDGNAENELTLTPIEFKLLVHFLNHESAVVSRQDLLDVVWGKSVHVAARTVDAHVSGLRKKLGPHGAFIRAIVNQGYCFKSEL